MKGGGNGGGSGGVLGLQRFMGLFEWFRKVYVKEREREREREREITT